jgi:hypothetical protein
MCFMLEREFQTILVALNVVNVKHFTNCKNVHIRGVAVSHNALMGICIFNTVFQALGLLL